MFPNFILDIHIIEVILCIKRKGAAFINGQFHTHLTRYRSDYKQLPHNLEIYNSRSVIRGCKLFNKLTAHIKQINHDQLFTNKMKELLLKRYYYSTEEYKNDDFYYTGIKNTLV
jgi:hypothetical protein